MGERDLPAIAIHTAFESISDLTVVIESDICGYVDRHFLTKLLSATRIIVTESETINFPGLLRPSNLLGKNRQVRNDQIKEAQEAEEPAASGELQVFNPCCATFRETLEITRRFFR